MIDFDMVRNGMVTKEWFRWKQHWLKCSIYPVLQIIPAIG